MIIRELNQEHRDYLLSKGLTDEVIEKRGYQSWYNLDDDGVHCVGLAIPFKNTDGETLIYLIKRDNPGIKPKYIWHYGDVESNVLGGERYDASNTAETMYYSENAMLGDVIANHMPTGYPVFSCSSICVTPDYLVMNRMKEKGVKNFIIPIWLDKIPNEALLTMIETRARDLRNLGFNVTIEDESNKDYPEFLMKAFIC